MHPGQQNDISIHAPREGGDGQGIEDRLIQLMISIHAPREGGDAERGQPVCRLAYFNPRPPRGGRPALSRCRTMPRLFQSTPPARGATRQDGRHGSLVDISIHAPREGGDHHASSHWRHRAHFNPRPPRGGRRPWRRFSSARRWISIHAPREGGDGGWRSSKRLTIYFNPRPPRGGRRLPLRHCRSVHVISIHAPREGGDRKRPSTPLPPPTFQSTPPARGAT